MRTALFLFTCQLESANPDEFTLLDGFWSKDNERVYHGYELVRADVKTFRFLGNNWAIDDSNAYHALASIELGCAGRELLPVVTFTNIDPHSFEVIDRFKAKDKDDEYDAL